MTDTQTGQTFSRSQYFISHSVLVQKLNCWNCMSTRFKYMLTLTDNLYNASVQFTKLLPPLTILWTGQYEHEYVYNDSITRALK